MKDDLAAWRRIKGLEHSGTVYSLLYFLTVYPAYRNVFRMRLPRPLRILLGYMSGVPNLYISTPSRHIGGGLYIGHGWGTVINAKSVGRNCLVGQNVTIGSRNRLEPVLGDNVKVWAHAVVLGDIAIGDNTEIGAGAVVVKSVPPGCVVTPAKSEIIRQDGARCKIPL